MGNHQGHFTYRSVCATLLGMDIAKLKSLRQRLAGIRGKTHVWIEPVTLALSRKANRPVKAVMSREEVFRASGPASSTSIDVKLALRKTAQLRRPLPHCDIRAAHFRVQYPACPGPRLGR